MEQNLNYWLKRMQTDPAALVPVLTTSEGRKMLQVGNIEGAIKGLMVCMEDNGFTFEQATTSLAPLLSQVSTAHAVQSFYMKDNSQVLLAWWSISRERAIRKDTPLHDKRAAIDWILLTQSIVPAPKTALPIKVLTYMAEIFDNALDGPLLMAIAHGGTPELGTSEDKYLTRCWEKLFFELSDDDLVVLAPSFMAPVYTGALTAFIKRCQMAKEATLLRVMEILPQGLPKNTPLSILSALKHKPWVCPMAGLFLLPTLAQQSGNTLIQDAETGGLLSMLEAVGIGLDHHSAIRQAVCSRLIKSTNFGNSDECLTLNDVFH